jgi:hypothetical protein
MNSSNGIDYYMPIMVSLIENKYQYDGKSKLPAHDFVLKPLLDNCIYSYVYGIKDNNELYINNKNILIKEKGKYKLDTTKDCINGHEYFWSAIKWERGSIIIILEGIKIFNEIFKYTYNPSISGTPNSGNTISAIKKCKDEMEKGNIGIIFPASNGMEWMQIYIKQGNWEKLFKMAEENCKTVDYKKQALKKLKEMWNTK